MLVIVIILLFNLILAGVGSLTVDICFISLGLAFLELLLNPFLNWDNKYSVLDQDLSINLNDEDWESNYTTALAQLDSKFRKAVKSDQNNNQINTDRELRDFVMGFGADRSAKVYDVDRPAKVHDKTIVTPRFKIRKMAAKFSSSNLGERIRVKTLLNSNTDSIKCLHCGEVFYRKDKLIITGPWSYSNTKNCVEYACPICLGMHELHRK